MTFENDPKDELFYHLKQGPVILHISRLAKTFNNPNIYAICGLLREHFNKGLLIDSFTSDGKFKLTLC